MSRTLRRHYRRDPADIIPVAWTSPWTPTEAEFTRLVLRIARAKGWTRRYHTRDSRGSDRGFPDWVMCHPQQRRILFLELKGFGGKASAPQVEWLRDIDAAGGESYLVSTTGDYARDAGGLAELFSARPPRSAA